MTIYRPISPAQKTNEMFVLSYKVLNDAIEYICKNYKIVGCSDALFGNLYTNEAITENTGINSMRIFPNGTITPSPYLPPSVFKSKHHIFDTAVMEYLRFDCFNEVKAPTECIGCSYEKTCQGGVYDRRLLWYGTLIERDPYCPFRHGYTLPKTKYIYEKNENISMYDGYLPTLLFKKQLSNDTSQNTYDHNRVNF